MPIGLAILSSERSQQKIEDTIIMAIAYRSFPMEKMFCLLKVVI